MSTFKSTSQYSIQSAVFIPFSPTAVCSFCETNFRSISFSNHSAIWGSIWRSYESPNWYAIIPAKSSTEFTTNKFAYFRSELPTEWGTNNPTNNPANLQSDLPAICTAIEPAIIPAICDPFGSTVDTTILSAVRPANG